MAENRANFRSLKRAGSSRLSMSPRKLSTPSKSSLRIDSLASPMKSSPKTSKGALFIANHSPNVKTIRRLPGLAKASSTVEKLKMLVVQQAVQKKLESTSVDLAVSTELPRIPITVTTGGKPIQRADSKPEENMLTKALLDLGHCLLLPTAYNEFAIHLLNRTDTLDNFLAAQVPEKGIMMQLLKATNIRVVSAAILHMKSTIHQEFPFKDVPGSWRVSIDTSLHSATVQHFKTEQSSSPTQKFQFDWTIKMVFDWSNKTNPMVEFQAKVREIRATDQDLESELVKLFRDYALWPKK